jgi:hypothetical protein
MKSCKIIIDIHSTIVENNFDYADMYRFTELIKFIHERNKYTNKYVYTRFARIFPNCGIKYSIIDNGSIFNYRLLK